MRIGYVAMGLPKYIFRLARNPIGHAHKRALHDSSTVQVQRRNPTLHRPHLLHWFGPLLDAAVCPANSLD